MDEKEIKTIVSKVISSLCKELQISPEEATEACHNAFEQAYPKYKKGKIRRPDYFQHYLYIASRNQFYTRKKRETKRLLVLDDFLDEIPEYMEPDVPDPDGQDQLHQAVEQLPDIYKDVAHYTLANPNDPPDEGAKALGITYNNYTTRHSRMLTLLKEYMETPQKDTAQPTSEPQPRLSKSQKMLQLVDEQSRLRRDYGNGNISLKTFIRRGDALKLQMKRLQE